MKEERYEIVVRKLKNGWYAGSDRTDFPGGNKIEVAGWPSISIALAKLAELLEEKTYPKP